jgi:hypothetical protein
MYNEKLTRTNEPNPNENIGFVTNEPPTIITPNRIKIHHIHSTNSIHKMKSIVFTKRKKKTRIHALKTEKKKKKKKHTE